MIGLIIYNKSQNIIILDLNIRVEGQTILLSIFPVYIEGNNEKKDFHLSFMILFLWKRFSQWIAMNFIDH